MRTSTVGCDFLAILLGAQRGSAALLFDDEYRGAEDRAELQGYIGEPLARSMVDALNEGRKYCLPFITVISWKAFGKGNV